VQNAPRGRRRRILFDPACAECCIHFFFFDERAAKALPANFVRRGERNKEEPACGNWKKGKTKTPREETEMLQVWPRTQTAGFSAAPADKLNQTCPRRAGARAVELVRSFVVAGQSKQESSERCGMRARNFPASM